MGTSYSDGNGTAADLLGDGRCSDVSPGLLRTATTDDGSDGGEVLLEGIEILDSEEDSEEDPFDIVIRRRPNTAPSLGRDAISLIVWPVRPKTHSGGLPIKRSEDTPPKNLMSILLPDNVENTTFQSDLSTMMGLSTQMTDDTSILDLKENAAVRDNTTVIDGKHLPEQDKEQDGGNYRNGSEVGKEDGGLKEIFGVVEVSNVEDTEKLIEREERLEKIDLEDPILSNRPNIKAEHTEKKNNANSNLELENVRAQAEIPECDTTTRRPVKRKSTLVDMCAKRTPVSYRVGLSKRANVSHLHSYLSK